MPDWTELLKVRDRIIVIDEEKERLDKEYEELRERLCAGCSHDITVETDFIPENIIFNARPPQT